MNTNKEGKSVFDMSQQELDNHFRPTIEKANAKRLKMGLPMSYHDDNCPTAAHFIHQYADGKKFLVLLNESTGNYTTVREIK